jgi:hypothetical protein
MARRYRWFRWLTLLLPLVLVGCPAHTSKRKRRSSVMDDWDDEEEEGNGEEEEEDGEDGVSLGYRRLPDAVVQSNTTGRPRKRINKLRRILCEGRENDRVIFYLLKVSRHWYYYWLCSETKGRRASSRKGAKRVRRWLRGFKRQAESLSAGCSPGSRKAVLRGNHESGIRATAHCDGQIVLRFPDGGSGIRSFASQGGGGSGEVGGGGGGGGGGSGGGAGGSSGGTDCVCPRCPICPQVGGRECPDCPTPRPCPPPKVCPQCPRCDCTKQALAAGRKGFAQGVSKACKRICALIYTKCRKINPNTALCHQVSEYCAATCTGKKQ